MAVSLLYSAGARSTAEPVGERLLYQLSLDRAFARVCPDLPKRERFLAVISALTDDASEIAHRQEVLRDFQAHPELLAQLTSLYTRFEELRAQQKTAGREEYVLRAAGTASAVSARNLLQAQALCLKRALMFVRAFGDLLARYELRSAGLRAFAAACREIGEHEALPALLADCAKYENVSTHGFLDFKFTLNEDGHIAAYEPVDHRYIHVTDPDLRRRGFSLFKKAEESHPCDRVYPTKNGFYDTLTASALGELAALFASVSEELFARFAPIGGELDFYEVALKYIEAIAERGAPLCFPRVAKGQGMRAKRLYDLYLLMTKENVSGVVPHDIAIEAGGLVLFGNNGSGKTVWLRSIGTAQILAQAGLPLPCESAELPLCSQLAAQFSEAEKEFCEGNEAGRFEQEVRELAAMADTLRPGALVFLNETFQSTAYAEGAEGLYHLLCHFTACGVRWILVSHLHRLEELIEANEAAILHMSTGYRVGMVE